MYLITAGHIVEGRQIDDLRVFHPETGEPVPFKKHHPPKSKDDRDDLWIFEIDQEKLGIEVARALKPIFLNRQTNRPLHTLPRASHLALKGYPSERGQVDETRALLTNRSYLTDGRYLRPDERTGLHQVRYFQENHLIKDHNGMCGAPWIVGNCEDEKWSSLLAGVHAEGGQEYMAIFIGADVLIERLTQIQ